MVHFDGGHMRGAMPEMSTFDVLVVGSGIAGTAAAIAACEERPDARVAIASVAPLFSGSSFATTTWLLGLVSPGPAKTEQGDLARRIVEVGGGLANEALVRDFASGIEDAVVHAQSWGVEFLEPSDEARSEREYVACFDDAMRHWRGLVRSSWREAVRPLLAAHNVVPLEGFELLDLRILDDGTSLATFFSHGDSTFTHTRQGSIVLATGGTASLWPKSIAGHDAQATVHAIAKNVGATCTNMAAVQFMPTIISPVDNVVFNEKAFRFMEFPEAVVRAVERELPAGCTFSDALDERSGYGPYSERLVSKAVDHAICRAGAGGLALTPRIGADAPELVRRYLDWLSADQGVSADAPLRVTLRAQASNGGIAIGANGETGVHGVYAAGECTGGMHGKDRIGGLSSANALTFGMRAGAAAARYRGECVFGSGDVGEPAWCARASRCWRKVEAEMKDVMQASFGPMRDAAGVDAGMRRLAALAGELALCTVTSTDAREIALTRRTALRLETAQETACALL